MARQPYALNSCGQVHLQACRRGLASPGVGSFISCKAQDSDTLCVGGFIRGLVAQICRSGLLQGYEDNQGIQQFKASYSPGMWERNPAEAFKR